MYTVFVQNPVTAEWRVLGQSEAGNQRAAIKEVAQEAEGIFAAIPTRSWHPVKIEKVVQERVSYAEFTPGDEQPVEEAPVEETA